MPLIKMAKLYGRIDVILYGIDAKRIVQEAN